MSEQEMDHEAAGFALAPWQHRQLDRALTTLFGHVDVEPLHALQHELERRRLSNGSVLFRQGEPADGMYIVVSGRLRATVTTPDEGDEVIGEIGPGEPVGEYALLTHEARSATVHAVRETSLTRMTPAVFVPMVEKDETLVDGGIMDNFPVEVMCELAETDRIIGVHVSPYRERRRSYDYDTSLSGWRILPNRINPFARRLRTPSLAGTSLRAMEVNAVRSGKVHEQLG